MRFIGTPQEPTVENGLVIGWNFKMRAEDGDLTAEVSAYWPLPVAQHKPFADLVNADVEAAINACSEHHDWLVLLVTQIQAQKNT